MIQSGGWELETRVIRRGNEDGLWMAWAKPASEARRLFYGRFWHDKVLQDFKRAGARARFAGDVYQCARRGKAGDGSLYAMVRI